MVRMAVLFGVEPRRLCRQSAPATVILQSCATWPFTMSQWRSDASYLAEE